MSVCMPCAYKLLSSIVCSLYLNQSQPEEKYSQIEYWQEGA